MTRFKVLLLVAFAFVMASCGGNNYVINGTITETDNTNGAIITLTDVFTNEVDTAVIVDGKFTFTGEADPTTIKVVKLVTADNARNLNECTLIPEKGTITVELDSLDHFVAKGPANMALLKYYAGYDAAVEQYYATVRPLEVPTTDEGKEIIREASMNFSETVRNLNDETFAANKASNAVALMVFVLQQRMYELGSLAEFDAYIEGAGDFIVNNPRVVKQRANLEVVEATSEGKMFADFKGETVDGKEIALSDYVGKGKYVLVDFWASWCGPCRAEIPNIINVYKEYSPKGLVVLGVPVWDKRPDTDAALKEMGIPYDQIYVGDDKTSTDIYGISGIPHIILFGPDGTIVKRDLRGDGIANAIKEVL